MGCDIHLYVEKKNVEGKWEVTQGPNPMIQFYRDMAAHSRNRGDEDQAMHDERRAAQEETESPLSINWLYDDRNYRLFSLLADVRNYDSIVPIAEPKGLPDDISSAIKKMSDDWDCDGHSHSYYTLAELKAYDWGLRVPCGGIINEKQYKEWKETGKNPDFWSRGVGGPTWKTISNEQLDSILSGDMSREDGITYFTSLNWGDVAKNIAGSFYTHSIPALEKLSEDEQGEDVRIVFWFDN